MLYRLISGNLEQCPTQAIVDGCWMGNLRDSFWVTHGGKPLVLDAKPEGDCYLIYEDSDTEILGHWQAITIEDTKPDFQI